MPLTLGIGFHANLARSALCAVTGVVSKDLNDRVDCTGPPKTKKARSAVAGSGPSSTFLSFDYELTILEAVRARLTPPVWLLVGRHVQCTNCYLHACPCMYQMTVMVL
jgi:hypothetical protein